MGLSINQGHDHQRRRNNNLNKDLNPKVQPSSTKDVETRKGTRANANRNAKLTGHAKSNTINPGIH